MTRASRDPLAGIDRLLVDGNNLLHALRRGPAPQPAAAIVGRLRATVPPTVRIELVFDGPPDPGSRGRVAAGVKVSLLGRPIGRRRARRAGRGGRPADARLRADDPRLHRRRRAPPGLLARGAATVRTDWLLRRMSRTTLAAPSVGARRSPTPPAPGRRTIARGWSPGRGATAKKGNARRAPKSGRRSTAATIGRRAARMRP